MKELILTGVIGGNAIDQDLFQNDFYNAIDLDYENFETDHIKFCEDEICISTEHEDIFQQDLCSNSIYLINYIKDDSNKYIPDVAKEYSAIYDSNDNVFQIVMIWLQFIEFINNLTIGG